jgi:hypothetical protein
LPNGGEFSERQLRLHRRHFHPPDLLAVDHCTNHAWMTSFNNRCFSSRNQSQEHTIITFVPLCDCNSSRNMQVGQTRAFHPFTPTSLHDHTGFSTLYRR